MEETMKHCYRVLSFSLLFNVFIMPNIFSVLANTGQECRNSEYSVSTLTTHSLKIVHLATNRVIEKNFETDILHVEISPTEPLVSIVSSENRVSLYHIERDKTLHLGGGGQYEQRWSNNGEFTFINRGTYFLIIKTSELTEYLIQAEVHDLHTADEWLLEKDNSMWIKITGHPLSLIEQVAWIDNTWLLYANGIGDNIAFGALDVNSRTNYFLLGCTYHTLQKSVFTYQCEHVDEKTRLLDLFRDIQNKGELLPISHNFYESIANLSKNQ